MLGFAAAGLTACGTVGAIHLTVTTSADGSDAVVGDGVCEVTPGAGDCSLRAAIDETNVAPLTFDAIDIAAGVDPVLTIPGTNDDTNATGDLDVVGNVTIDGGGAVVDGGRLDRVFDHRGAGLHLRSLTVTGGELSGDGIFDDSGQEIIEPGNGAFGSGAGIRSAGWLILDDTTVSGNQVRYFARFLQDPRGAGIAASGGPVHLTGSVIEGNRIANGSGGSGAGMAIDDVAELSIAETAVRDNSIRGNDGSFISFGVGIALRGSVAHIERSTIAENWGAVADASTRGAGIHAEGSEVAITRSTLSGNSAGSDYVPVDAVESVGGSLAIDRSTIVSPGPETAVASTGATTTIRSSVVTAPCTGTVVSAGWNVSSPFDPVNGQNGCGLTRPSDLVGVEPGLGPLGDNGGPTSTHLPGPGSPLVNRIPVGTAGFCDTVDADQRGEPAPGGSGCDVGAVEVQP